VETSVDFAEYQVRAAETDQQSDDPDRRLLVALLGLAGEVGTLLSEHKKWLRDGDAHDRTTGVAEDVGDILWYLAAAASALGLDLADAAEANLTKISDRWPPAGRLRSGPLDVQMPPGTVRDDGFPNGQRLPRRFAVALAPLPEDSTRVVGTLEDGSALGNLLGDNAYDDDGYRWHDAIHLAHAAVLGWSPVVRMLLGRKRKADPRVDDVEDGGRAIAIEEGISAAVFDYASQREWLDGLHAVDTALLVTFRGLARGLEVRSASLLEWEQAILRGLACWRALRDVNGGLVTVDLDLRTIEHRPLTDEERVRHADAARVAIERGLK
jgi:NTP pyrophosphatase (non-canonical NTP hydrolase)